MKFSFFKNDKTSFRDEVYLALFIIACIGGGVPFIIFAPSFWLVTSAVSKTFGVLWVIAGVMFIPGLVYRLTTNDKRKK